MTPEHGPRHVASIRVSDDIVAPTGVVGGGGGGGAGYFREVRAGAVGGGGLWAVGGGRWRCGRWVVVVDAVWVAGSVGGGGSGGGGVGGGQWAVPEYWFHCAVFFGGFLGGPHVGLGEDEGVVDDGADDKTAVGRRPREDLAVPGLDDLERRVPGRGC